MKRSKTLQELFVRTGVKIPPNLQTLTVSGVEFDSRRVQPGRLFVAVRGFTVDGHDFLPMAQEKGAVVAVVEEKVTGVHIPQIVVENSRYVLAWLAANFFRPEIDALTLVGITGTNGKTTTSFLTQAVLQKAGLPCGVIGTIAYQIGQKKTDAWNTTPEAVDVASMLFELWKQDYRACALEASSHALALDRVSGLRFKVGVFTNLTRDHLDFHKTLEAYFESKMKLFDLLTPDGTAVVNIDDAHGQQIIDRIEQPTLTYGQTVQADIHPIQSTVELTGISLKCATPFGTVEIHSSLTGAFNIQNIMAAVGAGLALGIPLETVKQGIESVRHVPGRLESYEIKSGVRAVIDYAHTPDSLEKALQTLRCMTDGRLLVVFGAGGDRDRGKRPLMGKVAEALADLVFVTSDNPRNEDEMAIIEDILSGMEHPEKHRVIPDRKKAIFAAVKEARPGDVLLVAGKGHETYQIVKGKKLPFDEVAILKEAAQHA